MALGNRLLLLTVLPNAACSLTYVESRPYHLKQPEEIWLSWAFGNLGKGLCHPVKAYDLSPVYLRCVLRFGVMGLFLFCKFWLALSNTSKAAWRQHHIIKVIIVALTYNIHTE